MPSRAPVVDVTFVVKVVPLSEERLTRTCLPPVEASSDTSIPWIVDPAGIAGMLKVA